MPLYEFRCPACGAETEKLQKLNDPPPPCSNPECERHEEPMDKKVSAGSFILKGSGWANDGYS